MQHQCSTALARFMDKLKAMSPIEQAGLAVLCLLTPKSSAIQTTLASQLSHFRYFRKYLAPAVATVFIVTNLFVAGGLMIGPLPGILGAILIGSIMLTGLALTLLVPQILNAMGIIVTAYRDPQVYQAIAKATRHRVLYLGNLHHSDRLLSGLSGNVDRPLDGIRILGALSDLIQLTDLDPETLEGTVNPAANRRSIEQENQLRLVPTSFSQAYGGIAEAMWAEHRMISALRNLWERLPYTAPRRVTNINRSPNRLFHSHSGSFLFEWLIQGQSPAIYLLACVYIGLLLSVPFGLAFFAFVSGYVLVRYLIGLNQSLTINPTRDSQLYFHLQSRLQGLFSFVARSKSSNLITPHLKKRTKSLRAAFQANRSIDRSELLDLALAIEAAILPMAGRRWYRQLLFFNFWEQETGTALHHQESRRALDLGEPPETSRADTALAFSSTLTAGLSSALGGDDAPQRSAFEKEPAQTDIEDTARVGEEPGPDEQGRPEEGQAGAASGSPLLADNDEPNDDIPPAGGEHDESDGDVPPSETPPDEPGASDAGEDPDDMPPPPPEDEDDDFIGGLDDFDEEAPDDLGEDLNEDDYDLDALLDETENPL